MQLGPAGIELLNRSFAEATLVKYQNMWRFFLQFALDIDLDLGDMAIC